MRTVSSTASALVLVRPRVGLALGGGSGGHRRVYFLAGKVVR